jgi:hypothetical protein
MREVEKRFDDLLGGHLVGVLRRVHALYVPMGALQLSRTKLSCCAMNW